jgi:D-alanine-D-alanine ligase
MRICLLTNQDLDADPFPDDDWPCDPRPFIPEADWHLAILEKATSVKTVTALVREGFDVYFNLCDGSPDEDHPGIEVVRTLERKGVPFTGATSVFFEPTRLKMKRVCRKLGVDTPAFVMARKKADVTLAERSLRFPLIVKHHNSYASIDLSRASRVASPAGLRRQAKKIMSKHGAALIEEFIEGTECTVLVAENPDGRRRPRTYGPVQYHFPKGETFQHSDMKWVDYGAVSTSPVTDRRLAAGLREDAAKIFVGLEGAGFGRCDFRVDSSGRRFLLEINANCGVYFPPEDAGGADRCIAQDPAGHEGFTRQLIAAALRRHRRSRRKP